MKVIRTEQIWLHHDDNLSHLCHLSKNLFNEGNYIIKQELVDSSKWTRSNNLDKILNGSGTAPSDNYKALPAGTAQWVLKKLDDSWKSFFRSIKDWKINPGKYKGMPKPPNYKQKDGENILLFTNQQVKIKDGIIKFPKSVGIVVGTRLPDDTDLRQVRIIPKGTGYVCEIVYKKEIESKETDKDRIVGIDLGMKNIIAMVNNIGLKPIIVKDDGNGIKSTNQFYNKRKAELQSIYDLQGIKSGQKMDKLLSKRNRKVHDYVHKLSRFIVDWCSEHSIGTIVFGYNEGWKHKVNIGRRNNQIFTQIPYMSIIDKTSYKAEEAGIGVILQEESHTSKCSFLDDESIEHHDEYVGKRFKRGLFRSAKGIVINSDVQGGYNIMKKAIPKALEKFDAGRIGGYELHPTRVNLLETYLIGVNSLAGRFE